MNQKLLFCAVFLMVSVIASGCASSTEKTATMTVAEQTASVAELAEKPYIDPEGYFSITPPKGWNTEDYPSDQRGKVAFSSTEGDDLVDLRVLVQNTKVTDFQEFVSKLKLNADNLGLQPEWQLLMFSDLPAIRSTMTYSVDGATRKVMNLRFLDGSIYHDIQFASPPEQFDKYQALVSKVMATHKIVKQSSEGEGSATAEQHQAAKYLVLAQAAMEIGDKKNAAAFVDEGLKNNPEDKGLLKLRESLDQ